MKYFIFLFLFIISNILISQDLPPVLKIKNATAKWQHLVVDENFEKDSFGFAVQNKYNCCVALNFHVFDSTVIVNNFCKNGTGDPHGYILQGIDIPSGKLKWQSIANNDNHLPDQEAYPFVYQRLDGDIDLLGFRLLGPPLTAFPGWRQELPSVPIRRIFDIDKGNLISRDTDESDTVGIKALWYDGLMMQLQDDKYAQITKLVEDKQFNFKLRTIGIDPYNFDGVTYPNFQFIGDSIPNNNSFGYSNSTFAKYGDHSIVGFVTQQDKINLPPSSVKVLKIDLLNDNGEPELKLDFEKNILSRVIFPFPVNGNFARIVTHEGFILVSMNYLDPWSKVKIWLLCLDNQGNEVFYIPDFKFDETTSYTALNFLDSYNDELYYLCQPSIGGKGADIVKVSMSRDVHYVGSYEPENSDFKLSNLRAKFTKDKSIVFTTVINSTYSYIAAYDPKDFNIDLTSSTQEIKKTEHFSIVPNPAKNNIRISAKDKVRFYNQNFTQKIHITDLSGRMVLVHDMSDTTTDVDISPLSAGLYFVSLTDALGRRLGQAQKFVKME